MFPRLVFKRSWSLFNLLKSLRIRIYFSKLYIRIFGDNKFIFCTNIINIIISWLWVILIRLFLLDKINSFTFHTIFNIIFELFLTLILNKTTKYFSWSRYFLHLRYKIRFIRRTLSAKPKRFTFLSIYLKLRF